jgi:hypothetical protein
LREEQVAALICREFGWTWEEYRNQPAWFIDIILEMLKAESELIKKEYGRGNVTT